MLSDAHNQFHVKLKNYAKNLSMDQMMNIMPEVSDVQLKLLLADKLGLAFSIKHDIHLMIQAGSRCHPSSTCR